MTTAEIPDATARKAQSARRHERALMVRGAALPISMAL